MTLTRDVFATYFAGTWPALNPQACADDQGRHMPCAKYRPARSGSARSRSQMHPNPGLAASPRWAGFRRSAGPIFVAVGRSGGRAVRAPTRGPASATNSTKRTTPAPADAPPAPGYGVARRPGLGGRVELGSPPKPGTSTSLSGGSELCLRLDDARQDGVPHPIEPRLDVLRGVDDGRQR